MSRITPSPTGTTTLRMMAARTPEFSEPATRPVTTTANTPSCAGFVLNNAEVPPCSVWRGTHAPFERWAIVPFVVPGGALRVRVGCAPDAIARGTPDPSVTATRYTFPAMLPAAGAGVAARGSIVTLTLVAPGGSTNDFGNAIS
jgi:hypothetical protein